MSARSRFVEAMKLAWLYAADTRMARVIDDACDAFSDAQCESCFDCSELGTAKTHDNCRASLRRECGLEGKR